MKPQETSGTKNSNGSDSKLEQSLREEFSKSSDLQISDLSVRVQDGHATLEGTAKDDEQVQRARALAERMPSIRSVTNQIACKTEEKSEKTGADRGREGVRPLGKSEAPATKPERSAVL